MAERPVTDDNDRFKASNILGDLIDQIMPAVSASNSVSTAWYDTVSSIRSFNNDDTQKVQLGTQLADHSTVIDLKNGVLIVETDHPGRLQLLQMHKRYILEGLRRKVPDLEIKNISYKIK